MEQLMTERPVMTEEPGGASGLALTVALTAAERATMEKPEQSLVPAVKP
jgi:hypothetical protein